MFEGVPAWPDAALGVGPSVGRVRARFSPEPPVSFVTAGPPVMSRALSGAHTAPTGRVREKGSTGWGAAAVPPARTGRN